MESTVLSTFNFKPGDILLETSTVTGAIQALQNRKALFQYLNRASLIQFIETLVLHERVFVDKISYESRFYSGKFDESNFDLSNVVFGVTYHESQYKDPVPPDEDTLKTLEGFFAKHGAKGCSPECSPQEAKEIYYSSNPVLERGARYSIYEGDIDAILQYADGIQAGLSEIMLQESQRIAKDPIKGISWQAAENHPELYALIVRTLYYFGLANMLGLPYAPNVTRAPVLHNHLMATQQEGQAPHFADVFGAMTYDLATAKIDELNNLLGRPFFKLDVPVVFNYVLKQTKRRRDILRVALDVRNRREARAFRKAAANFDLATKNDDRKTIIEGIDDLQHHANTLRGSIAEPSIGISIGFPLSLEIEPITALRWAKSRRRHLVFMSELYKEAISSRGLWRDLGSLPY